MSIEAHEEMMLHALARTKRNDTAGAQAGPAIGPSSPQRDAHLCTSFAASGPIGSYRNQEFSGAQRTLGNQAVLRMLDRGQPSRGMPRDHVADGSSGNVESARKNHAMTDAAELPRDGNLEPEVDLTQVKTPTSPDAAPADAAPAPAKDAAEGSCCKFASFSASNDSYKDTDTDTRKNIQFTCKLKAGANAHKCAMVNWVQGTAKNKDGSFRKAKVFDKIVDINFPALQIDSVDKDPVYWSDSVSRWHYTVVSAQEFSAADSPGPTTWGDGIDYDLKYKMCLHCIDDVTATSDASGSGVKNPLQCIAWTFKAKYDAAAKKFTH